MKKLILIPLLFLAALQIANAAVKTENINLNLIFNKKATHSSRFQFLKNSKIVNIPKSKLNNAVEAEPILIAEYTWNSGGLTYSASFYLVGTGVELSYVVIDSGGNQMGHGIISF